MFRAGQAIVHAQVDDLEIRRHDVALHEFLGVAMCRTEKQHINLVERKLVREDHIRLTKQAAVYIRQLIAGVAGTVHEDQLHIGMIQQEANQLTCRIARTAYDSALDHISSSLWLV